MSKKRKTNLVSNDPGHIVCVGASAGGLEALTTLLKFLPQNINMAFVLIQHLEPHHKSALAEILSREAFLNICEAKNNTKIEPGYVYVISPNTFMTISSGRLKITSRIKRVDGRYLPIDLFMTSLAEDQGKKAVGVILSGTGSDGTLGVKAIKAKGGIIFVQDEKTARYYGMPGSAIASGTVDFVLAPRGIAIKLVQIGVHGFRKPLKRADRLLASENELTMILVLLQDLTGVDFIHYKRTTISRRVDRRMSFRNIKKYSEYYDYMKKNPTEAKILLKDILISVTVFFRDSEVFTALKKIVFPFIANNRSGKDPIRVWVPACSTGEEVYSIAIALYEFLEEKEVRPNIQIFGTDLSEAHIEKARAGSYARAISAHVSAERLRRFFVKTESGYKIVKHIRDLCIFAKHDIITASPLPNMDIASCRNLLIYFDTILQNKALLMLHYALKPKGFLVLGTSESVTAVPGLFTAVNKRIRIYSKNIVTRKLISVDGTPIITFKKTLAVGRAEKSVGPSPETDKPLIWAHPKKVGVQKRYMTKTEAVDKILTGSNGKDIAKIRKEFARTVVRLNAISEEKDTFNEELKAASEEIQSSNEELQSLNEELETSREELQSTNEELLTVNDELQNKNTELTHLNSDLSNVFSSTNIPIIIVGNDLCIKRFTPTARKVMNLIPTDVDRPIGDIKLNIDIANLEEMILSVIEDMVPKELEVKDKEGRWYSMFIRPYRTIDNKIDGAVIAMIDIDVIKRSKEEMQGALDYTQAIIETMREPLVVLDEEMRILSANKSFYDTFRVRVSDVANKRLYELGGHQWNNPKLRKLIEKVLPKNTFFNDFEVSFNFPDIGQKTMILNGRQIKMHGKEKPMVLLVIEDITKRKKAEDILKRDNVTLDKMINKRSKELMCLQVKLVKSRQLSAIGTLAATVAHELRNPLTDIALLAYHIKKITKDPLVKKNVTSINARISESDQIINNILMYSKTTITHYEFVKINDLLKRSIADATQNFPIGKISINEKIDRTKALSIEVDPVRIREVFRNILHNAIDAVHTDTGIIEIESRVNNSMVSILIKDNGIGIARKDLKNVTRPFFTTKVKGTGLGLAVCKQVATLHGGSIIIKSAKRKGTTVAVTLPINKQKDA